MKVTAICIGDELLDGRIRDRNAANLGSFLRDYGLELDDVRVVADDADAIGDALDAATDRADLVVVSGGLGPTGDDITRRAAADWAGQPLEVDEAMADALRERFEEHGYTFTENNRRQCAFPAEADVLDSKVGTAAGFRIDGEGSSAWFLPGVPEEFEWFLDEHLDAYLEAKTPASRTRAERLTFLGIGESDLEARLDDALDFAERQQVAVSFLPNSPLVEVQLRGRHREAVESVAERVREAADQWLVYEGDDSLAERVGEELDARDATLATAESCTGGWLSKEITDVPGSSGWFEYGFVTYANRAKIDQLGVRRETLQADGAVSRATVVEMARGARDRADADYAVSISGVAGPSGGTPDSPVGTVHFGLADPDATFHRRLRFPPKSRRFVRRSSVKIAFGTVLWRLQGRLDAHDVERVEAPG